eukprot:1344034-Amorphochlora_amoeboformis.AAC.1
MDIIPRTLKHYSTLTLTLIPPAKNPHDIQYDVLNPNRWRRFKVSIIVRVRFQARFRWFREEFRLGLSLSKGQRKPGARDNTKDIKKTET